MFCWVFYLELIVYHFPCSSTAESQRMRVRQWRYSHLYMYIHVASQWKCEVIAGYSVRLAQVLFRHLKLVLLRSKPRTIFDILNYRKVKKLVRGKANFAVSSAHITRIMTSVMWEKITVFPRFSTLQATKPCMEAWEQLPDYIYLILCMYVMPLAYAHVYMHLHKNQVTLLVREKVWCLM